MPGPFSTADLSLARRIEAAEAANGFELARSAAAITPSAGVVAEPFFGGCALFAGIGSPMTHALGIGMQGSAAAEELDRMEAFFRGRGSPVLIDLCPMADPDLLHLIFTRGYRAIEFNNVMVRRIDPGDQFPEIAGVDVAEELDRELWNRVVVRGFQERDDVDAAFLEMMAGVAAFGHAYLARIGGEPAGAAGISFQDGVACLHGDATLLRSRGRGVQQALISARLRHAARAGCDLAAASVLPGSGSHRNYERAGFQLFFMRVNLSLP
jgi:GNAT superfamily N-acetyltransferase